MKNEYAFTLIELLAVVVILAVIALISTPIIMDVIENAQRGALKNTAYGITEAGAYAHTSEVIKTGDANFTAYTYEDGVETSIPAGKSLEYKGTKPKTGTVLINSKGNIAMAVYNGKHCAEKGFDDVEIIVSLKSEDDCKVAEELTEIEVLVVAGGGSGGSHPGGTSTAGSGGGAGGLIYNASYAVNPGSTISVDVGAGGVGTTAGGNIGENSVFGTLTAIGGGRGTGNGATTNANGGSGGGDSYYATQAGTKFGLGIAGQGNNGGASSTHPNPFPAAGGGGAGSTGGNATATLSGGGGAGLYYGDKFGNDLGTSGWFAGGGGGGIGSSGLAANSGSGQSGGGNGGYDTTSGTAALVNTGSGGGGSGRSGTSGGNGGSGIVIVRYYGLQKANGGAVTTVDGYTIHTFESGTGTFEIIEF